MAATQELMLPPVQAGEISITPHFNAAEQLGKLAIDAPQLPSET